MSEDLEPQLAKIAELLARRIGEERRKAFQEPIEMALN
jgi:hypothetical protein